jgi:hypothetical protein
MDASSFDFGMTLHLDHKTQLVAGHLLSGSAVATQPSIERVTAGELPSLGYFPFGSRDRIADAQKSEFIGTRHDLARDGRRPRLPICRRILGPFIVTEEHLGPEIIEGVPGER